MDFIDDFIQEYKNNPCLWKTDSIHFKNRIKRQEAYMKLIDVAARHDEHYNVERTKQKINNLRCAFRHQLKKFFEFKKKGEKEEPYCPKRRYFESLMFLKDEENSERKTKDILRNDTKATVENRVIDFHDPNHDVPRQEVLNGVINSETTVKQIAITSENDQFTEVIHEQADLMTNVTKYIEPKLNEFDKEYVNPCKKINHRKRSLSISSQVSNDGTEFIASKSSKTDDISIDFEKIFSLACKNIQSNMDDHFSNFGKLIAHKLRLMDSTQAIYAEKIIADVMFQGQMKMLSSISINQFLSYNVLSEESNK